MTTINTSFRDFADKSYLTARNVTTSEATTVQKVLGAVSFILMFVAVGGMLVLGSIPPQ